MGKRYYCDYCERSFKDDTEARKKHLSSLQHAKNRAEHYSFFKDAETILSEERLKTVCKRFMNSGECAFGNGCKFSHYDPSAMRRLQQIVAETKRKSHLGRRGSNFRDVPEEYVGAELAAAVTAAAAVSSSEQRTERSERYPEWWSVSSPDRLLNYPNLPPSLWPITPETVTDSDFGEWGF